MSLSQDLPRTQGGHKPPRRRFSLREVFRQATLIVLGILSLFPLYFSFVNSFKTPVQFAQNPVNLPPSLGPGAVNYAKAWGQVAVPTLNSLLITIVSVLLTLGLAALAAYAFALLDFPGKKVLFALVFGLLLVPDFLTLIPLYVQIKKLALPSNYLSVIFPYIAAGQAFSILVLRTFFEQIPKDLLEAARIDGAGLLSTFTRIVLPISLPVLTTVGIIRFVPIWNDFLLPSLLLDTAHRTLPVALVRFQGSAESYSAPDFGALMAAYVLSALPLLVLFSFLMRSYIEGLTSGAVKA
ncbi:carbohydrate ABC transporter permease [Deinococcus alpinitundrae]|uniref:carbohydrate ABC transporter permease n=1 Tax=Deinococcus alpinitundrae TaxID=468913 RepID=UPI0013794976|nr:carbohydrate ABC transporter permease [Deinococcus alpinitundrae]